MKPVLRIAGLVAMGCILLSGIPRPIDLPLDSALSGAFLSNFHDREDGYRWTRARSLLELRDLGGARTGKLEVELSAFRPPGMNAPRAVFEVSGKSQRLNPRRLETLVFELVTPANAWNSELRLSIRSETFTPGDWDRRPLGVRVHRVRFLPAGGYSLSVPPLRLVLAIVFVTLGVFFLLGRFAFGLSQRGAEWGSYSVGVGWLVWFLSDRLTATTLVWPILGIVGLLLVASIVAPRLSGLFASTLLHASAEAWRAMRRFGLARALGVASFVSLSLLALFLMQSRLSLELGSGRGELSADAFSGPDQQAGKRYRTALRGARLSFPDHGSGRWSIRVTASTPGVARAQIVANGASREMELTEQWSEIALETRASYGWTSGPVIELPTASPEQRIRIHRIDMTRGGAVPPLRLVSTLCLISVLLGFIATGSGLSANRALLFSVGGALSIVSLLAVEPILMPPFMRVILLGVFASWAFVSLIQSLLAQLSQHELVTPLSPMSSLLIAVGVVAWFSAQTYPLYVGGHFGFHSAIAEEIWEGKFLLYYLPYPGSMLARQPQWGDVIVPHSCLYHTLVAPLAALPRVWFHGLEKLFLAFLLASVAALCAITASSVQKRSTVDAGVFAALAAVSMPISFQLLGLGHLMTLFGVFAGTVFLAFLVVQWESLRDSGRFGWGLTLLSLAFLSYTATLLFTLIILAMLLGIVWRRDRAQAKRLLWLGAASCGVSLILYYGNWVVPFMSESVSSLLGGAAGEVGESTPWLHRIGDVPSKLRYSFGSAWIPILGLGGLTLARPNGARLVLYAWALILPLFLTADLAFNFLLKHHYFTYPAVAIGLGLVITRWQEKKGLARIGAWLVLGSIVLLGVIQLFRVATGVVGVF